MAHSFREALGRTVIVKVNAQEPVYISVEPFLTGIYQIPQKPIKTSQVSSVVFPVPPDKVEVQRILNYWLDYYGVSRVLGNCIVSLESGYNPLAKNPYSSAAGVWQFIRSTFNSTAQRMGLPYTYDQNVFNAHINAQMGAWLLANDGYTHWVVWRSCI